MPSDGRTPHQIRIKQELQATCRGARDEPDCSPIGTPVPMRPALPTDGWQNNTSTREFDRQLGPEPKSTKLKQCREARNSGKDTPPPPSGSRSVRGTRPAHGRPPRGGPKWWDPDRSLRRVRDVNAKKTPGARGSVGDETPLRMACTQIEADWRLPLPSRRPTEQMTLPPGQKPATGPPIYETQTKAQGRLPGLHTRPRLPASAVSGPDACHQGNFKPRRDNQPRSSWRS